MLGSVSAPYLLPFVSLLCKDCHTPGGTGRLASRGLQHATPTDAVGDPYRSDVAGAHLSIVLTTCCTSGSLHSCRSQERTERRGTVWEHKRACVCVLCIRVEASVDRGHLMSYN